MKNQVLQRSEKEIIEVSILICEREIYKYGIVSYVGQKAAYDIKLLKEQLSSLV